MKGLFLICALALPVETAPRILQENTRLEELRALRDFIHKHYPDAEIRLVGEDDVFDPTGWERVPLLWRDLKIYVKRAPVYDRRRWEKSA